MQQNHTETALADTATNAQWQLAAKQLLVEIEFLAVFLAFQLQLAQQTLLVHTNTHGTQLETSAQYRIPDQDIAIKTWQTILSHRTPVIVVGSSAIMLLSIAQLATDSLDEYGTILLADGILTLLGSLVGIHIQQLLGMNKVNLFGQERLNLWIMLTGEILSAQMAA